jgi:hypothetical protein
VVVIAENGIPMTDVNHLKVLMATVLIKHKSNTLYDAIMGVYMDGYQVSGHCNCNGYMKLSGYEEARQIHATQTAYNGNLTIKCYQVRFVAFLVTEYDEVFSGYQPKKTST